MKRVAFIALGLLLFAGGVLAGRYSVREPIRVSEFEQLEERCLEAWLPIPTNSRRAVRCTRCTHTHAGDVIVSEQDLHEAAQKLAAVEPRRVIALGKVLGKVASATK